jgi:uncharacterized membrane-anchored protein
MYYFKYDPEENRQNLVILKVILGILGVLFTWLVVMILVKLFL